MLTAVQGRSTSVPKKAILPFSSLVLLPALGWGSNVTAVCESHWVNGLVGGDGIDKLAFAWKLFPGLTNHMDANDDPDNRVERGEKEQGGTLLAAEWIYWIKVVV